MKKQILVISMVCMILYADSPLEERFEDAITNGNAILVSQLLRDLDQDSMSLAQKKSLLTDLSELAEGVFENKKSRIGLFRNAKDCAMGTIGSLVGVFSLLYLGHSCYAFYKNYQVRDRSGNRSNSWEKLLLDKREGFITHGGISLIHAFLSTYIAYNGLTCSAQKVSIMQSEAIRQALEDKKVELGL